MKLIKIIKVGKDRIKLDLEDWKAIRNYKIGVYNFHEYRYAMVRVDGKQYYLHRYIIGVTDKNKFVDHINGDTLDCRRSNMRVCTNQQNQWNAKKKSNSKQEYKCIRKLSKNRYEIRIRYRGKRYSKYTKTLEEAKHVYDEWVKQVHGEYAK